MYLSLTLIRQSLQLHILKLRKWHYHITDLLVWFWGSLKEKKMSAKFPTDSGWGTLGSMHTFHGLWFRCQPLGWDHLDSTLYSALHCETSGRSSNLYGAHQFNLSNRSKNAPQHQALLPRKGSYLWEINLQRENKYAWGQYSQGRKWERKRHTHTQRWGRIKKVKGVREMDKGAWSSESRFLESTLSWT